MSSLEKKQKDGRNSHDVMLVPLSGRSEDERNIALNSISTCSLHLPRFASDSPLPLSASRITSLQSLNTVLTVKGSHARPALDGKAEEVRASKIYKAGLANKLMSSLGLKVDTISLSKVRAARNIQNQAKRETNQASYIVNLLLYLIDVQAHIKQIKRILHHELFLFVLLFLDISVDLIFSCLYLFELQYNASGDNFENGIPGISINSQFRWLYVARPLSFYTVCVAISGINALSYVLRFAFSDRKLTFFFSWITVIDIITFVPFIVTPFFEVGQYIYIPYFLRIIVVVPRTRRLLRYHGSAFGFNEFRELLIILLMNTIAILYTAMCAFNYVELHFQPVIDNVQQIRKLDLVQSIYFVTITMSTVGYGDVTPTSTSGRLVVIVMIMAAVAVVPSLASRLVETLSNQSSGAKYSPGSSPFVVVCGVFDDTNYCMDIVNVFLHEDLGYAVKTKVVLFTREKISRYLKTIISSSNNRESVSIIQASSSIEDIDFMRVSIDKASAVFLLADKKNDPLTEDADNTLRAWTIDDLAPNTPIYAYNRLPETETFQESHVSKCICINDLKQVLLGYSILYRGSTTLLTNLINQTDPFKSYNSSWEAQYGDGSGNEFYSDKVNPLFVGKKFCEVSWYLYKEFQIILFAVKAQVQDHTGRTTPSPHHTMLNPGLNYAFKNSDVCIYIAQNFEDIKQVSHLSKKAYAASNHLSPLWSSEADSSSDMNQSVSSTPSSKRNFVTLSSTIDASFPKVGGDELQVGKPESPYTGDLKIPFCHLLVTPPTLDDCVLKDCTDMQDHILVCTGNFDLFKFVCTLRAAHLTQLMIKKLLFLSLELPTEEEFHTLSVFPGIFYMKGDFRKKKVLMKAGIVGAEKVLLINLSSGASGAQFSDSTAVMVSHLIFSMFRDTPDVNKVVLLELEERRSVKYLLGSSMEEVMSPTSPSKSPGKSHGSRLTEAVKEKRGKSMDYLYRPIFAAGRVLVTSTMDTILFQTYNNPAILEIFNLCCGIRYAKDVEMDALFGLKSSYLCYVNLPQGFVGQRFESLYEQMASIGTIPIGLFRAPIAEDAWGNTLPFVYTNPLPSVILRESDLVYVLTSQEISHG